MRKRVVDELTTTFKSHYSHEVSLTEALNIDTAQAYNAKRTGEKYLIKPPVTGNATMSGNLSDQVADRKRLYYPGESRGPGRGSKHAKFALRIPGFRLYRRGFTREALHAEAVAHVLESALHALTHVVALVFAAIPQRLFEPRLVVAKVGEGHGGALGFAHRIAVGLRAPGWSSP